MHKYNLHKFKHNIISLAFFFLTNRYTNMRRSNSGYAARQSISDHYTDKEKKKQGNIY